MNFSFNGVLKYMTFYIIMYLMIVFYPTRSLFKTGIAHMILKQAPQPHTSKWGKEKTSLGTEEYEHHSVGGKRH